ncbi:MAG: glycosyltransferase family 2 protein, partial [Candidatus Heimdallarchaeota archaeon]|nr:glycosyltransferase family 2 protein [Candidatus Heimdallarchaeota archaeon]
LDSLMNLSYPSFSIVLVDNGSSDDSGRRLTEKYPKIHHIQTEKNLGFAGGNNVGIRYILDQGIPYVLLLNNDTEVIQPDFLTGLVNEINQQECLGAIGPRVRGMDGSDEDTILPFPTIRNTIICTLGQYRNDLDQKQFADSITGCCVLVRSEVIKQIGYFDEQFFIYGEETEWFFRMRQSGWKVGYLPIASIIHKGASSSKNIEDSKIYIEGRSNVIYTLVKHNQIIRATIMFVLMFLFLIFRIILFGLSTAHRPEKKYSLSMIPDFIRAVSKKWHNANVTRSEQ